MTFSNVAERLYHSLCKNEEREALPGITYKALGKAVEHWRKRLRQKGLPGQCVGLLSAKNPATYALWIACWMEAHPIVFISSAAGEASRKNVLSRLNPVLIFEHMDFVADDLDLSKPVAFQGTTTAYYIPTSGSTGEPKIIRVNHSSLNAWIENSSSTWDILPSDRVSQVFDLSFDPAISDVLWAFLSGACLVPLDFLGMLDVAGWIQKNRVTVWSSSPSQGKSLILNVDSSVDSFISLRRSTFIGEILTNDFALAWHKKIPSSVLENHYGPAECVISVSREIIQFPLSEDRVLKVGSPYPGVNFKLDQNSLLTIESNQVAEGYVDGVSRGFDFKESRQYHTGDHAAFLETSWKILGRQDSQIKINGQRWESEGIEASFESVLRIPVCIVKWSQDSFEGIDLVILGKASEHLKEELEKVFDQVLPASLRPRNIWFRSDIPLNSSGKLDRRIIQQELIDGKLKAYGS